MTQQRSSTGGINALTRLIGHLVTEVWSKPSNPNKPLNRSLHQIEQQPIDEHILSLLDTATNIYRWGPGGGVSDFVDETPKAARWEPPAVWG